MAYDKISPIGPDRFDRAVVALYSHLSNLFSAVNGRHGEAPQISDLMPWAFRKQKQKEQTVDEQKQMLQYFARAVGTRPRRHKRG